jgi:hypothetical protein
MQVSMIGTFAMGPIIKLGIVKFCKDYWTPPGSS